MKSGGAVKAVGLVIVDSRARLVVAAAVGTGSSLVRMIVLRYRLTVP